MDTKAKKEQTKTRTHAQKIATTKDKKNEQILKTTVFCVDKTGPIEPGSRA